VSASEAKGEVMASSRYDIITVGGGLGGAALAKSMENTGREFS
jgi:choline dehydrogenase-like flavoprotein